MTTIAINYSHKMQSKISSIALPQINWKVICFTGFMACSFLLLFYIYQILDLTKGSYLVNFYEDQITQIAQENKDLEVNFAENDFLGGVLTKIQDLNFQKTTSVSYIQILDSSVATAKTR